MKTYAKFTEINDWEGETWNFYIPIKGNEKAMDLIDALIDGREEYFLRRGKAFTEQEIDALCARESSTSYMNKHNKVSKILELPESVDFDADDDPFYKGKCWELE